MSDQADRPGPAALLSAAEADLARYVALNYFGCRAGDALARLHSDPQTPYVACPGLLSAARGKLEVALSAFPADAGVEELGEPARARARLILQRLERLSATVLPYNTLLRSSHKVFGIKPTPAPIPAEQREDVLAKGGASLGFERAISSYDDDSIFAFVAACQGAGEYTEGFSSKKLKYLALVAKILCSPSESQLDAHQIGKEAEELVSACKEWFSGGEGKAVQGSPAEEPASGKSGDVLPPPRFPALTAAGLRDPDVVFYLAAVLLNARVRDGPEYMDEPLECVAFVRNSLAEIGRAAVDGELDAETPMDSIAPVVEALFSTHLVETPCFMLERALAHQCSVNHDYQGAFERYTAIGFLYEALEILLISNDAERAKGALLTVLSKLFEAPRESPSKDLVDAICRKLSEMGETSSAPASKKRPVRRIGESYLEHQRFFTALLYAELGLAEILAAAENGGQEAPKVPPETQKGVEDILLHLEKLNCRDARVQRDLGELFLCRSASDPSQLQTAFAHYRKASQLDSAHLATKDKLGAIYMKLFQLTKDQKYLSMAYEMYRRVADGAGDSYQAAANLGNVCTIQGDLRQSSSYFYAACRLAVSMDIRETTVFTRYLYQCFAFIMECEKMRKQLKEEEDAGDAREGARVAGPSGTVVSSPTNPKGVPLAHKNRSTVEQFVFVSSALPAIAASQNMGPDKAKEFLNTHLTLITSISYHLITSGVVKSARSLLPALQPWQSLMNDYAPLLDDKATVPFADMLAGALGGKEE